MSYEITPFTENHLEAAAGLLAGAYSEEKAHNPILPERVLNEPGWIVGSLRDLVENPGVAVLENNRLIAYMLTGFFFPFKGQNAVLVPEYCHASVPEQRDELYRRMYMSLAEGWAKDGKHIHIMAHFAHDTVLKETLYQLGFGAFLAERLRDTNPVQMSTKCDIEEEKAPGKLLDLHLEHYRYYPESPIFITHDQRNADAASLDLESHIEQGDSFLVYYEQEIPSGYFIIGGSKVGTEGFMLRETNTAQVKAAFVKPGIRRKGIGEALLQAAVDWSIQHGYERLFVEHETANYYGGKFWSKHFSPYLNFSLRYIDNTIKY